MDVNAPRIYLAGPDVFLPDAERIGREKCTMCAEFGFVGIFPLDGGLELDALPRAEQARRISLVNEGLMRSCDAIVANLTPFRGAAMDSGTAFEVGFMRALGKPIFGYTNVTPDYADRAVQFRAGGGLEHDFDRDDVDIEDFGLAENLMIAIAVSETGREVVRHGTDKALVPTDLGGFRKALEHAAALLTLGEGQ